MLLSHTLAVHTDLPAETRTAVGNICTDRADSLQKVKCQILEVTSTVAFCWWFIGLDIKHQVLKYEPYLKMKWNAFLQKVEIRNRNEEKYDFKYECVSVQHLHKVIYTTFFKAIN